MEEIQQARKPRSYASSKLRPSVSLTRVKSKATSVANKKRQYCSQKYKNNNKTKTKQLWKKFYAILSSAGYINLIPPFSSSDFSTIKLNTTDSFQQYIS